MRRLAPILLAVLGGLLIAGSLGWSIASNALANPAAVPLPGNIAGLQRSRYATGQQAVAEFRDLHGEDFLLVAGAVGVYGDSQITVWAAGTPVSLLAAQLVDAMHNKIAEGRSPFVEVKTFQDRGRTVYALEGMGQNHYYFQSESLVIWLAAEPALADESLRQILEAYP